MHLSRRAFLAALAGLPAVSLASPRQPGSRFALAGDVIHEDTALARHAVLVDHGVIQGVVPAAGVTDRPVIDSHGFILPGVINAHVHRVLTARERRERFLRHGVTAVGDAASPLAALSDLLYSPAGRTATAACAGPMLCPPGGYPLPVHTPDHGLTVTSPAHGREQVRRLADAGATMIKLALEPGPTPRPWPVFDRPTAAALCDEARRLGLVARCHVEDLGHLATALDAGVHTVEHVPHRWITGGTPRDILVETDPGHEPIPAYLALLERMTRERVIMTPTLDVLSRSPWDGPALYEPVRAFHRLGGRIALGNDHPYRRTGAGMPLREMALLGRAGLGAQAVLRAATRTAAAACGMGDRGSLATGKRADIVVVRDDPLADTTALKGVTLVVKDGVMATGTRGGGTTRA